MSNEPKIVFFGTPQLSVWALEEMQKNGIVPDLIVTMPDKPAGRGQKLTPPPVKIWADEQGIKTLQLENINHIHNSLFVVFAYGKILPKEILDIPKHGTLNIHPSMLPKLRGPSPIRTAILQDELENVGVSVIVLDEEMDHGPIVVQQKVGLEEWPIMGGKLDEILAREGGRLLAQTIPKWVVGKIEPKEQEHEKATFSNLFKKEDALIDLNDDPYQNYLQICAYDGWPGAYFFPPTSSGQAKKRIKITAAHMEGGELIIDKVIPEGKKEIIFKKIQTSNT